MGILNRIYRLRLIGVVEQLTELQRVCTHRRTAPSLSIGQQDDKLLSCGKAKSGARLSPNPLCVWEVTGQLFSNSALQQAKGIVDQILFRYRCRQSQQGRGRWHSALPLILHQRPDGVGEYAQHHQEQNWPEPTGEDQ